MELVDRCTQSEHVKGHNWDVWDMWDVWDDRDRKCSRKMLTPLSKTVIVYAVD